MENKKQKTTTTSTFQSLSGVFRLRQKLLTEFTAPLHNGIQERFKSDPIKVNPSIMLSSLQLFAAIFSSKSFAQPVGLKGT